MLPLLQRIDQVRTSLHNLTISIRSLSAYSKLEAAFGMVPEILYEYKTLIKYLKKEVLTSLLLVSPLPVGIEHWQLPQRVFLDLDLDTSERELTLQVTKFTPITEDKVSLKVNRARE